MAEWSNFEDDMLREYYQRGDVAALAELLGRTPLAVRARWQKYVAGERDRTQEIQRNANSAALAQNHKQLWTPEEDELLASTLEEPVADVAEVLSRSIFAISARRRALAARHPLTPREAASETYGGVCSRCQTHHRGEC